MKYYIDTEFDGHNGPLLSLAIIKGHSNISLHIRTTERATDPWVIANVEPFIDNHYASVSLSDLHVNKVGEAIYAFLSDDIAPVIVADSPVDIARFCRAISTGKDGEWTSVDYPRMTFEVHNVDCYPTEIPGAIQHNAWWDAMALRALVIYV